MMIGKSIREFFRDLFGSRLVAQLSEDLLRLRTDLEERLQERDETIAILRGEKAQLEAKVMLYEMTIMPRASRMGAEIVGYQKPAKPHFGSDWADVPAPMSRWQMVQADYEKQLAKEAEEEAKKPKEVAKA